MVRANVVILNLSALSESVMAELWALNEIGVHEKTFVVMGENFPIHLIEREETELLKRFPHQAREDDFDLQDRLSRFVAAKKKALASGER